MHPKAIRKFFTLMLCLLTGMVLTACGGGGSSDSGSTGGTGTLQVSITDYPAAYYDSVVITIREIRVVPAGDEGEPDNGLPIVISYSTPVEIDILDLAYQQKLLGENTLPDGDYTQLRLILAENADESDPANYFTRSSDTAVPKAKIPIKTPSGQTSGLKVLGGFAVEAGVITTIVLDFDPEKTIVEAGNSGNWIFKPTGIRVVQVEDFLATYGAITGTVLGGSGGTTPLTTARVYAIAQPSGTEVAGGNVNPDDATFRLMVPSGSYELRAAADGHSAYSSSPTLFTAIIGGPDTNAGNIVMTPQ